MKTTQPMNLQIHLKRVRRGVRTDVNTGSANTITFGTLQRAGGTK